MVADNRLIVALDSSADEAMALATTLRGKVRWIKIGMTLFYANGPHIVGQLKELGFDVFLDLKLNDIPHQVSGAAAEIAKLGVGMFTVHASGGAAMMRAAVEASRRAADEVGVPAPSVLAVTVLTSTDDAGLAEVGVCSNSADQVSHLTRLAAEAGVDGIVCSPQEATAVRELLGDDALLVTPGVRPGWSVRGDQARIATPADALKAGASHLVIGRPITDAPDPVQAVARITTEIA